MEENEKALSGRAFDILDLNLLLYGQMDPDVPPISMHEYLKLWPTSKEGSLFNLRKELHAPITISSTTGGSSNNFFKNVWDGAE